MKNKEMVSRVKGMIDKGVKIENLIEEMFEMWNHEVDEKHRLMIDNAQMRKQLDWSDELTNNLYGIRS